MAVEPICSTVVPSDATLKKYGLTVDDWINILVDQGGVCPICEKFPSTGRFVIDHFHVKGYKDLPREKKKKYTRGITCWFCNHAYLGRGITIEKAENMTLYLKLFEYRLRMDINAEKT